MEENTLPVLVSLSTEKRVFPSQHILLLSPILLYLVPHALLAKPPAAATAAPAEPHPHPTHAAAPLVEHKPLQKFGTMATKPKVIHVFRNGDIHDAGTRITLKTTITTMDKLYQTVNNEVHLVTGSCRKIVTPAGHEIKTLQDFQDEGQYIALAGEPLNKERMSKHITQ